MSRAAPGPEDRHTQNRGTDGGGTATGCAEAVVTPSRPAGGAVAARAGFRAPVVWVLLAIAFFTSISGKPVDGVLMLIVAVGLAWDAGHRALRRPGTDTATVRTDRLPRSRPRFVMITLLTGAVVYAVVVGSFGRYSWPATAGIIALGTVVVLIGWHGPVRARRVGVDRPALFCQVAGRAAAARWGPHGAPRRIPAGSASATSGPRWRVPPRGSAAPLRAAA